MSDLSKPYVVQVWYREIYKRPRTTELEVLNDGVEKPLRKKYSAVKFVEWKSVIFSC